MVDNTSDDIDSWRRVHRQLTLAIIQSRDNIAAELTKRRYLLEEMNRCKIQHTQRPTTWSSGGGTGLKAKKKAAPKKVPPPKKPTVAAAPIKSMPVPPRQIPKAVPAVSSGTIASVTATSAPKTAAAAAAQHNVSKGVGGDKGASSQIKTQQSSTEGKTVQTKVAANETADDANNQQQQQYSEITPQQLSQMYYPQAQYDQYGLGLATPEAMGLAFQMMQQMQEGGEEKDNAQADTNAEEKTD